MESERPPEGTNRSVMRHCEHGSMRLDGTLDDCCLRCGADGYWHEGRRLDVTHPSGKLLFRLPTSGESAYPKGVRPCDLAPGDVIGRPYRDAKTGKGVVHAVE